MSEYVSPRHPSPVAREELRDAIRLTCWGQRELLEAWLKLPSPAASDTGVPLLAQLRQLESLDPAAFLAIKQYARERLDAATPQPPQPQPRKGRRRRSSANPPQPQPRKGRRRRSSANPPQPAAAALGVVFVCVQCGTEGFLSDEQISRMHPKGRVICHACEAPAMRPTRVTR